jgi:hypothetical protein
MGFPAAAAGVGAGAGVLGAIVGAIGNTTQGQAQANMYNYQAGVAQANATIAKQDANYAVATGDVESQQSGEHTRDIIGQTRTGIAAGNIDLSGGSAGRVVKSEVAIGQENEGIIQSNAAKRAYGFSVGAAEDVAQAGAYKVAAETSKVSGDIGAVSSILGGVSSVSSKWMQASQSFGSGSGGSSNNYSGGIDIGD